MVLGRGLPHGHARRARRDQATDVSREDQDAFALSSHQKAIAAIDAGRFDAEMAPVTVRDAKGRETVVTVDEGPRRDTTMEALARLKPAFALPEGEDRGAATVGTVTAGNAPGITDGAAATVVASERAVERLGLTPLARIVGYAQAEVAPKWLFLAPIEGVRRLLDRIELPIEAFDLIEINEAFAAQTLADGRDLGFDWSKVNVNGGAIALGHPIGASGARIVATLVHELARRAGPLWARHPVPRRRWLGRGCLRTGLTRACRARSRSSCRRNGHARQMPDTGFLSRAARWSVGPSASSVSMAPRRIGWQRPAVTVPRTSSRCGASWSMTICFSRPAPRIPPR